MSVVVGIDVVAAVDVLVDVDARNKVNDFILYYHSGKQTVIRYRTYRIQNIYNMYKQKSFIAYLSFYY